MVKCYHCGNEWEYSSKETKLHTCFNCGNTFSTKTLRGSVFVYLIECQDKSIYTGITKDPDKRYSQHETGKGAKYTKSHGVKELLGAWECNSRSEAAKIELSIKNHLSSLDKRQLAEYWNDPDPDKPYPYELWKKISNKTKK